MCSATTTKKTEDLVKVALKKEPIYIGIEEKSQVILTLVISYLRIAYLDAGIKLFLPGTLSS